MGGLVQTTEEIVGEASRSSQKHKVLGPLVGLSVAEDAPGLASVRNQLCSESIGSKVYLLQVDQSLYP